MKLIFIRHGDPDYKNNTLTKKGWNEALLLAKRVASWKPITDVYLSPYGRAQDTAKPFLEQIPCTATTLPWLQEFDYRIKDPRDGHKRICWDWLPRDFFAERNFFNARRWFKTKAMKSGSIEQHYKSVCAGIDDVLAQYDYTRISSSVPIYNCLPHLNDEEAAQDTHLLATQKNLDERNIVFVCHLGIMFAVIGYLTGISPVQLWQGFFVAPTSVTVLGAEERIPGEVVFRVQMLGDARHLAEGGEPLSASGFFGNVAAF
ncbi:MAG: histidine phosphatase family protein [Treponema sp.]|nr:histidine phosphatase family protein [Treponema sp.]